MAQRNQLVAAFCGLDRGNPRHPQHIALGEVVVAYTAQGRGLHAHLDRGRCGARGHRFGADIDHARAAAFVNVGEIAHRHSSQKRAV